MIDSVKLTKRRSTEILLQTMNDGLEIFDL